MRIATWNVNSIKARKARVLAWLDAHGPDVLCLQELKCTDEAYPAADVRACGYESLVHGQKAFNGVALLSPGPASNPRRGLEDEDGAGQPGDPQARLAAGDFGGVTVYSAYFPNGHKVGSDKYAYKLAWMGRLLELLDARHDPGDPVVLAGDFNVALDDLDAAEPEKWAPSVLCHSEARAALQRIQAWGFVDVVRKHHPGGGPYTWWDYRRLAFPRGDGLRIDHVFATRRLADLCTGAWVDRDQRKGRKTDVPSDHVPVVAEFDLAQCGRSGV